MFPQFKGKTPVVINLDWELAALYGKSPELLEKAQRTLFENPDACAADVATILKEKGAEWGYGGYLEDRSRIWAHTYLAASASFLHLGIDCYVPEMTVVCADFDAVVHHVDHDDDPRGGWGGRLVLRPEVSRDEFLFIYAHLESVSAFQVGQPVPRDATIGMVGSPRRNGGWFPHLHVQMIGTTAFDSMRALGGLDHLDGYAQTADIDAMRRLFPDPTPFLRLP